MDFALNDEQQAVVDLAAKIFGDLCAPERLREVESGSDWFHRELWAALASADLLGLCLPESVGGGGYGFLELCLLLQELGRTVAPVPFYATAVLGALPIAEFGTDEQQRRWLPGVASGDVILTGALNEIAGDVRAPHLAARPTDDGWTLDGVKTTVPAMHLAQAVVVPARTSDGDIALFVVPTDAAGLVVERQDTFNHEPQFHVTFDGVAVGPDAVLDLRGDGAAALGWLVDRATVGLCAIAAGVSDRGMHLTATYVTDRKQFDRPIGSFQAVGHRMADCFIDNEAIRLSMLQAATQLAEGGSDLAKEVAVAKYWASYSGSRVGHADLHLHGGISIDLDYPIHRYFLWAKHLEFTLGAATPQLAVLGARLAAEPVSA
jgi:alkylation response protein AidB-like acyl-CoA dehydrogenase